MTQPAKLLAALLLTLAASAQLCAQTVTIMSWNALNFSQSASTRVPHFQTIIDSIQLQLLVTQEIQGLAGANYFHTAVLQKSLGMAPFIDGNDLDHALYYDTLQFEFISNLPIQTALRDIAHFTVRYRSSNDTLHLFSVHLKASGGLVNQNLRAAEVDSLRKVTDQLHAGSYYLVCGDFNMFGTPEPAYQRLTEPSGASGYFVDPIQIPGSWDDASYAQYHTQSPRVRQFDGGAIGGLDDRFDLILFSPSMMSPSEVEYVEDSTWPVGNDGLHYHDSINAPPNALVSQEMANALHYASDHLPLIAKIEFNSLVDIQQTASVTPTIYPNPSSGLVQIELAQNSMATITVSNLAGSIVLSTNIQGSKLLDFTHLPAGLYLMTIETEMHKLQEKLYLN